MANVTLALPDSLMAQLSKAGSELERIADAALAAAAKPVSASMQSQLQAALSVPRSYPRRSSGELISALGVTPVRISKGVYNIKVGFAEPRRGKTGRKGAKSNAMVANLMEHGHSGRNGGQTPAPFVKPATKAAKQEAEETLRRVVEDELQKIFGGNT